MIIDITGTILTPGDSGKHCLGNGKHSDIECCCDECDYMICCLENHSSKDCQACTDKDCPHFPHFHKLSDSDDI